MVTFVSALLLLLIGAVIYGAFVERVFGADPKRPTPCQTMADGIDYASMPTWKVYLIQFLNIAGTGPIFGAIQGILFGPSAYIWIVAGCILGGAVHDYLAGMISLRKGGASLPEIVGDEISNRARRIMQVFTLMLMLLVGSAFTTAPAGLLAHMFNDGNFLGDTMFWFVIVLAYYFLATMLPIDKVIGKIYPLFGIALLIMAVALLFGIFMQPGDMPEIGQAFTNHHPTSTLPILPGICITISCGAVSGFHATQSPMMARCLRNEKYGRPVFYGAMVTEGVVALIWAAAVIKFADSFDVSTLHFAKDFDVDTTTPYGRLWAMMTNGGNVAPNPALLVNMICQSWLGKAGAVLVILGVVAAPITTGDTAFRCARLIVSDMLNIKQNKIWRRAAVSIPVFGLGLVLMFVKFDILWRYLFWFNQNLSFITLWAITAWLARKGKLYIITMIPAIWMTWVCVSYILVAPEGFALSETFSNLVGIGVALFFSSQFWYWKLYKMKKP